MVSLECLDREQIAEAAKVILQLAEKLKKNDITESLDEKPISLQICMKKIPFIRNKVIKIVLPVSLAHDTVEVCLFTRDLDKKCRDYELTVIHYKELLQRAGVQHRIEVIPLKCLTIEYQPYEAKRNLSNLYDIFLSDDHITHRLPTLLGKHFLARKRYPVRVNLEAKDLKKEIDKALSTTQCIISGRGSALQVTVARTGMKVNQIVENVMTAISRLVEAIPGGANNIRNIHMKTADSPAIPLYVSIDRRSNKDPPVPVKKLETIGPEEVTTVYNSLVKITPYGEVMLVKKKRNKTSEQNEREDKMKTATHDKEASTDNLAEKSSTFSKDERSEDNLAEQQGSTTGSSIPEKQKMKRLHSPDKEQSEGVLKKTKVKQNAPSRVAKKRKEGEDSTEQYVSIKQTASKKQKTRQSHSADKNQDEEITKVVKPKKSASSKTIEKRKESNDPDTKNKGKLLTTNKKVVLKKTRATSK